MREYKCDVCKKPIVEKSGVIIDNAGLVKFRVPGKSGRFWAGFEIRLKSNSIADMCAKCVIDVFVKNRIE